MGLIQQREDPPYLLLTDTCRVYEEPVGVKEIGNRAFSGCTELKKVTLPNSVVRIGMSAFEKCPNLKSIKSPRKPVTIGQWAFSYCPKLHSVNIRQIGSFGEGVFENSSVHFPHQAVFVNNREQLIELAMKFARGDIEPENRLVAVDLCKRAMEKLPPDDISEFIGEKGGDQRGIE